MLGGRRFQGAAMKPQFANATYVLNVMGDIWLFICSSSPVRYMIVVVGDALCSGCLAEWRD